MTLHTNEPPTNERPAILSFGEILWDVYGTTEVIGGAPFNVAAHLARLGIRSYLYSRVGRDRRGVEARRHALRLGVHDRWLQEDDRRPTGSVNVTLDPSGQPAYQIQPDAAWDAIEEPTAAVVDELRTKKFAALVCGTLAQRAVTSRQALAAIRRALPEVPVFYDVNLRGVQTPIERVRDTLPGVVLLKVNQDEAEAVAEGVFGRILSPADLFAELRSRYGIEVMVCTRGAEGCAVYAEGRSFRSRAEPIKVASAVGAGDAFSAAFLASWIKGLPLEMAASNANTLGGAVAASPETVPDYPADLLARLPGLR